MNYSQKFKTLNTSMMFVIPLFLTSLLCSCEQDVKLSNENALQVLNQEYKDFCNAPHKTMASTLTDGNFIELEGYYHQLKSMGLVEVRTENYKNGQSTVHITATQKAVKEYNYIAYTSVAVAKLVPKEIVGISINQETKTAEVIFVGEYEITPFTRLSHRRDLCKAGERFEKKATFIHYDSGWRLKESGESTLPL